MYILIALISTFSRVAIYAIYGDARFYYPDSWDYVVLPTQSLPPRSFHPPTIWKFWEIFTFGSLTESHVLILQGILGILTTLLIYKILSKFLPNKISIPITIGYILTPMQYFFERNFLPESTSLFFAVLLFALFQELNLRRFNPKSKFLLIAIALILGMLVSLKPLYSLFALLGLTLLLSQIFFTKGVRLRSKLIMTLICVITTSIPVASLSTIYLENYGVFSTSPASGSFLISRWANLVSCESSIEEPNKIVKNVIGKVCEADKGRIPGGNTSLLYLEPIVGSTLEAQENFAYIQERLQRVTLSAIIQNFGRFFYQLLEASIFPFTHSTLPNDISMYRAGSDFFAQDVVLDNFENYYSWFSPTSSRDLSIANEQNFLKLLTVIMGLPTYLYFWIGFLAFVMIGKRGIAGKKINSRNFAQLTQGINPIMLLYVFSLQLMISLTSVINFRLYLSFIPIWFILIGKLISSGTPRVN